MPLEFIILCPALLFFSYPLKISANSYNITKDLKYWFWFLAIKLTPDGQDRKTSLLKG
jgi:hypothetical protein